MLSHFTPNSIKFCEHIEKIVKENNIEIVQAEMVWSISSAIALPTSVKKVFVHHELRYVCHELELAKRSKNSYEQVCYTIAKTLEIGLINQYDAIITLSETDKKKLLQAGVAKPIFTSFAVINTKPTTELHSNGCHMLTYVGPQLHNPNYKGVMWFLENCWEKILGIDPDYHFKIIGKWNTDTVEELTAKYKNIEFVGYVEDLNAAILDTIAIVPLTVGSGIRMKILEAATIGVPFVTTTVGVEGLPFQNGEDCFISDTPDDFVNSIITLRDEEIRMRLISHAQKKVMTQYSIEALRLNRMGVYEHLEQ